MRRLKCDEVRPSCGRCSTAAHSQCSFLADKVVLPFARRSLMPQPPLPSGLALDDRYGSLHLHLLFHLEHDLCHHSISLHPGLKDAMSLFTRVAFATPYLMDELLAYAAAHKSILDPEKSGMFMSESTKLQTRALALYNRASPKVSQGTGLPMFIFSSLLSHHIIFTVSSSAHGGLDAVIDGLTRSIVIHRGLAAIATESWPLFSVDLQQQFIRNCRRDHMPIPSSPDSGKECDALLTRLDAADITPTSRTTLCRAVETLQDRFDTLHTNDPHAMWAAVQDWLMGVPAHYIELLNQKQPEAVVVLAHFAVLLDRVAEHWFVGDLGIRLMRLIDNHLGSSWEGWLEWPNQEFPRELVNLQSINKGHHTSYGDGEVRLL